MLYRLGSGCLLGCMFLVACGPENEEILQSKTAKVRFVAEPFRLEIMGENQTTVLTANQVLATTDRPEYQPQLLPGWDDYRAGDAPFTKGALGRMIEADGTRARAAFRLGKKDTSENGSLSLSVSLEEADRVKITLETTDKNFDKVALGFAAAEDEHWFGLGERFASVDHRGLSIYSWAEEGGLGAGEAATPERGSYPYPNGASMTYFPVPFVHSTAGYSLLANTTRRTEMRMASDASDRFTALAFGQSLPIVIYTRSKPLDRLNDYTKDTGRPMIPAPWVWGARRRASARGLVFGVPEHQIMRQRGLPATMFDDSTHMLPHNSHFGREQELKDGNDTLHAWGYKVAAYNTPYIAQEDPMSQSEFRYGVENGLFQLATDGSPALTVFISGSLHTLATIDLTNPLGFEWYKSLLRRTVDLGYDGWMNDFGEYTQRTSLMADGTDGNVTHNLFPVLSAKAASEVLEAEKPNDYLFFVRSGYVGTQQYASQVWGGDSEASFDDSQGLPSAVRGGLNLAFVGVSQYGSDTTGFKCIAGDKYDKEVYIRWLEFAAVSPIFHEENACANPVISQTKWNLWNDDETQDAWRNAASFHTRMAPYLRTLAVEANATGTPVMRHPFLTHPDERDGWAVEDSYFFGPSLYAAPVVRRGVTQREVWLPPGRYVEWTERTVHEGPGVVSVPAPLMRLPLFLVENTLLPLLDADVQTLAPATEPSVIGEASRLDVMDVVAAIGPEGEAEMTLADGTTINIHRGDSHESELRSVEAAELRTCAACAALSDTVGDVSRARFNSELGTELSAVFEDLHAIVQSPVARRYRFEILRTN